ncbi:zinc metalloproteinase-disintegrin-like batroxstatin-2 [Spea bombifrons]|uniref:zinc metalloproteinase-disintegrin-like batroxstatin-2 n=1 Tax=Spea bombifrons TaxID=233779 RepID=UPI00234A2271|nr:zinc metalloproteinase-disintegrin-like batroxstatin-2 [Spea bombifrons]
MLPPMLVLLGFLSLQVLASDRIPPGQKYEVVLPRKLHTQHKRDTQSKHPDLVQYGLELEGQPFVLHLEKTEGLISENYTETSYLPDGTPVTNSPRLQDHCYYHGHVKNDSDSAASISTCSGLSGVIVTRGRRFLIEPLKLTDTEEHAVFQAPEEPPKTCGVTNTTWLEGKSFKSSRSSGAEKQAFLRSQKYVRLYMVADNTMFVKYDRSAETVKKRIFEIVNYVNLVYKAINTFVALTGMEIWEKSDQFQVVPSASVNLDRFSSWRKERLLPRIVHDNAQFITNTDFDGATVGLAYVGTMCSETHSTGVIQDHSKPPISVGATVAHEMGHNLGMNHDSSSCTCDAESCIMSASLSYKTPKFFSSCSHQNFKDFIYDKMPQCMKISPLKTHIQTPPVCGNKFTELGEDCDCGTEEECTNPCCDAATCRLKATAQCAEGECCKDCQIRDAGDICRPAKDDCDLADMCDGKSAFCSSDRYKVNGFSCRSGEGSCYNGKCPTLQSQCTALWGASSQTAVNSCFNVNQRGTNYGYCLKSEGTYVPCEAKDVKCGVLYCSGGADNPNLYASVAAFSNCKAVLHPNGMVENGTKCGDGMVCYSGKCVTTESAFKSTNCSSKCPGHAVCDHELQCRCQEGWAPPTCDTASSTNIIIIVVAVILAVALLLGLVLMVVFCRRSRRRKQSCSPPTISGATNPSFGPQVQQQQSGFHVSTPELTTRNLLHPHPSPPANSQKPQISFTGGDSSRRLSRDGYQGPQYSVASRKVLFESKPTRPTTAPPPVPPVKPAVPPPPPQALKPPVQN